MLVDIDDLDKMGIFRDALPGQWGRRLMQIHEHLQARVDRRDERQFSGWDVLLGTPDASRQGALRFRLPGSEQYLDAMSAPAARTSNLRGMATAVQIYGGSRLSEIEALHSVLDRFLGPGVSLGGSRPKAIFIEADGTWWIAKFPAHTDAGDLGAWECLAHRLAKQVGIDVPRTRLLRFRKGRFHTFCVQRFDRVFGSRLLYASAETLLEKKEKNQRASYLDIAELIRSQGNPRIRGLFLEELFRRVAFNVAMGHRNDHLRKHGFLRQSDGWQLAPAFGMTPYIYEPRHALNIDASDNTPCLNKVLETAPSYGLTSDDASNIVAIVVRVVASWEDEAIELGIARSEIEEMRPAFSALSSWSGR